MQMFIASLPSPTAALFGCYLRGADLERRDLVSILDCSQMNLK